jgi:hypothetical protein
MSRSVHFTLTDRQHAFLIEESVRTGLSMAELARRALDSTYRPALRPIVAGFHVTMALTRGPDAAVVGRFTEPPRRVTD